MKTIFVTFAMLLCFQCESQKSKSVMKKNKSIYNISKTEAEWKTQLTDEEYAVLRQKSTEMPFSGEYNMTFEDGTYYCKGCGNSLFDSESKFKSECGWPSFDTAIEGSIEYKEDNSLPNRPRTEILCQKCGGHIGHVFKDGPTATGLRYCVNSVAVDLEKE